MISHSFQLKYNEYISFEVWAMNAGIAYKDKFSFFVPKPLCPFDSWVWDEKTKSWQAPIPYPLDGNKYVWNEETFSWLLVTS
jgi:hypothetical protein